MSDSCVAKALSINRYMGIFISLHAIFGGRIQERQCGFFQCGRQRGTCGERGRARETYETWGRALGELESAQVRPGAPPLVE